ncbi:hypothetical protein Cylst_4671 [Cylindrospermum stagnale PCC 7417]|uniref:Glycine zipper 2TM domain-containing protein n=1 Tax=Cylindrospermum stagnale PCC 7417 TaxID=56107 RepID=K9X503_9NOST|nr:hypothetical protein [Cylindrospermum stagnale]AFZ26737.1 hypothetical protein Cylst_4671 [Cylindrospermum stagnale PCC 7417]
MNQIWKRTLISSLITASLAGVTLVPAKPAAADDQIIRDVGIGAAASVTSGAVRRRGSVLNNAVKGAAAGAAVNLVNGTRSPRDQRRRNLRQDIGVGAAASTAVGAVTRGRKDTLGDAVDGAVAGAVINIFTNRN